MTLWPWGMVTVHGVGDLVDQRPARLVRPTHIYGNMVRYMKTTIDISDELLIAAKKRAAEERTSLKAVIERGLRVELKRRKAVTARPRIRWVTVDGGVAPGLDVSDRAAMHDYLRRRS